MRSILLSGLALAALMGSAMAQTPPPAGAPPQPGADAGAPPPPPPPGGPDAMANGPGGPPPGGPEAPRGRRPPPPPPPTKAAHFHLERGDTVVDVKCAEDEPMKACADLTLQLLDRLQAAPKD